MRFTIRSVSGSDVPVGRPVVEDEAAFVHLGQEAGLELEVEEDADAARRPA